MLAVVVGFGCVTACSGPAAKTSAPAEGSSPQSSVVALGDSVPHGNNCHCTPYPPLTASGLAAKTGQTVTAANDAVGGYTSADVLRQIDSDNAVIDRIRTAEVVEIEVGANDVGHSDSCGTNVDCYARKLPEVQSNLDAIVARVHDLTANGKVLVVLLDYWSVWLGGRYAAAKGEAYVDAAAQVTGDVNALIQSTATRTKSGYVDLRKAFKGPNYAYDETHYLSDDGDHPNAAGHQQIASATRAVIEDALHI